MSIRVISACNPRGGGRGQHMLHGGRDLDPDTPFDDLGLPADSLAFTSGRAQDVNTSEPPARRPLDPSGGRSRLKGARAVTRVATLIPHSGVMHLKLRSCGGPPICRVVDLAFG